MNDLAAVSRAEPVALGPARTSRVKEITVISGKGGTGKTSLVASFAALARHAVLADCDVDAADLHLLLEPRVVRRETFSGGKRAHIRWEQCTACGQCQELCRFGAIRLEGRGNQAVEKTFCVDPVSCEGCGVCAWFCAAGAIEFSPAVNGEWFISETRLGPMVHAKLGVAGENSGKLVTTVRTNAKQIAEERGRDLVLIDGSPGIGCPVIASISGVDLALVVTEPTLSGLHDLERVAELTCQLGVPAMVCINKWDLNPELSARMEAQAGKRGLHPAGVVRYDRTVTEAQVQRTSIVEYRQDGSAADIRRMWARINAKLAGDMKV